MSAFGISHCTAGYSNPIHTIGRGVDVVNVLIDQLPTAKQQEFKDRSQAILETFDALTEKQKMLQLFRSLYAELLEAIANIAAENS